jgi:hypothetical protein
MMRLSDRSFAPFLPCHAHFRITLGKQLRRYGSGNRCIANLIADQVTVYVERCLNAGGA